MAVLRLGGWRMVAACLATLIIAPIPLSAAVFDPPMTKNLLRRALLDRCVYSEAEREAVDKKQLISSCQCAATRVAKDIPDSAMEGLDAGSRLPQAWIEALRSEVSACVKP